MILSVTVQIRRESGRARDFETVTDQTYRDKWMLIYFGHTFCPDAWPTALSNISGALAKLGPEALRVERLFIAVDPKRDTPKVMADYLQSFDPRIVGLTGSQAQTDSAAKAYRVYVAPQKGDRDDYLADHSAYLYVVNPQGFVCPWNRLPCASCIYRA